MFFERGNEGNALACPNANLPIAPPHPPFCRCDRLDSHVLNERPDEGNELAWRHGTFKSQADIRVQHLAEDPCACAEQGVGWDWLLSTLRPLRVLGGAGRVAGHG